MRALIALVVAAVLSTGTAWATAPTFDPAGGTTATWAAASSKTFSLTTNLPNDVIIVCVAAEEPTGQRHVTTVADTSSLTWAKRGGPVQGQTHFFIGINQTFYDAECWWAYSALALTADSITVTMSASMDAGIIHAFGVNAPGSSSAPFDANVSLPGTSSSFIASASNVSVAGLSTTTANDLIYLFSATQYPISSNMYACSPPDTQIAAASQNGSVSGIQGSLSAYRNVSATQSGITVSVCQSDHTTVQQQINWGMIVDAVAGGATPTGGVLPVPPPGVFTSP